MKSIVKVSAGSILIFIIGFYSGAYWSDIESFTSSSEQVVVAKVGDYEITVNEMMHAISVRGGDNVRDLDKSQLLEELIIEQATIQYALANSMLDMDHVHRQTNQILLGQVKRFAISPQVASISISDQQIEDFYQANRSEFIEPAMSRYALLRLRYDQSFDTQNKEKLRRSLEEILTGKLWPEDRVDFGTLAVHNSDVQSSRYRGGDIGWIVHDQITRYPELVMQQGQRLERIGDVSTVIDADGAFYLVRLMDRNDRRVSPLASVSSKIYRQLLVEEQNKINELFVKQVLVSVEVERFPQNIPKIDLIALKKEPSLFVSD